MIDDALERLRESNPVPDEVQPPPLDFVLRQLGDAGSTRRRSRARVGASLMPAAGIAAAVAVAVAVVAIVLPGHHSGPAGTQSRQLPTHATIPTPRFGMPGVVRLDAAAFPSPNVGLLSIEQCHPCQAPAAQLNRTWQVISRDGGRSWHVVSAPALVSVQFSGTRDGWGIGLRYRRGGGVAEGLYASHDGGLTWSAVSVPAGFSIASASVAAGTVWASAIQTGCAGRSGGGCAVIVLRGPAGGNSLSPVADQPPLAHSGLQIFAASAATAYLDAGAAAAPVRHLVTRDGGRTWQELPGFCSQAGPDTTLTLDSPSSLWRFCVTSGSTILVGRSTDGGVHWRAFRVASHGRGSFPYRFRAASSQVAWAMSDRGDVTRTTDGGRSWQNVWSRDGSQKTVVNGTPETLTAVDSQTAYVAAVIPPVREGITNGTYIVTYQTHDGGRSWRSTLVPLPPR